MYKDIVEKGASSADSLNYLVNEELGNILQSDWEKLLFKRLIRFDLIDGTAANSDEISEKICFDKVERLRNLVDFLAFDSKNMRSKLDKEKKSIPQRVFVDGEIKIKYGFTDNHAKKVIVVFQGKQASLELIHSMENKITHKTTSELFQHDKYQFFKYSKKNKDYDFIFLEDDFNFIHGWYMTNYGKMIYKNLQYFLSLLSKNYEEIHLIGSSKGGYGAYHTGKDLDFVKSITLIAPVLEVDEYIKRLKIPHLKQELSNSSDALYQDILSRESVPPVISSRITIYSGKSDYSYKKIKDLITENPTLNVVEVDEKLDHMQIIRGFYKEALNKTLGLKI